MDNAGMPNGTGEGARELKLVLDESTVRVLRKALRPSLMGRIFRAVLYLIPVFLFLGVVGSVANLEGGAGDIAEDVVVSGKGPMPDQIAVISISGEISGGGSYASGTDTVGDIAGQLRYAVENDRVKGVILQIDSPGGGLTAGDTLHNEVTRLKTAGKPVVVLVGDMAASGGYYIAAPADEIIAGPTSLVGSFGVIMSHMQVNELMQKVGVRVEPIKSTAMKDIGSPFREMSEEEKAFFQQMLERYHERFVKIISDGRHLPVEAVREIANGKVYSAEEALGYKLIDKIGYWDEALDSVCGLAGVTEPEVVRYSRRVTMEDLFAVSAEQALRSFFANTARVRFELK